MKLIENKEFLAEFDALVEKYSAKVEEPFKIEKGKWYMCIKDVVNLNNKLCFKKGKVYQSEGSVYFVNENGDNHFWFTGEHCEDYFRPATEDEIPQEPQFKVTVVKTYDGTVYIKGLSNLQYDVISDIVLSWNTKEYEHLMQV